MLTSGIIFVNFKKKNKSLKLRRNLQSIVNDKNEETDKQSKDKPVKQKTKKRSKKAKSKK